MAALRSGLLLIGCLLATRQGHAAATRPSIALFYVGALPSWTGTAYGYILEFRHSTKLAIAIPRARAAARARGGRVRAQPQPPACSTSTLPLTLVPCDAAWLFCN